MEVSLLGLKNTAGKPVSQFFLAPISREDKSEEDIEGQTRLGRMSRIPQPLPMPAADEIERARTDKSVRERVRKQLWRVRRREEEIARLTAENADCVYGDVDVVDHGDVFDDLADNYADRYVYLHHILYAHMVHPTRIVLAARGLGVYGHVSRCPEYLRGSTLHIVRKK